MPCNIVAAAACHALKTFDKRLANSPANKRNLTDINFVNIKYDITCCMIDVFKRTLRLPVPGMNNDFSEKHQFLDQQQQQQQQQQ